MFVDHYLNRSRIIAASQKAMIALDVLPEIEKETKRGRPEKERKNALIAGKSTTRAAQAVGVSPRYVEDAKAIETKAPELAKSVRSGEKTISEAKTRRLSSRKRVLPPVGTLCYA